MGYKHYCDMCGLAISGPYKRIDCNAVNGFGQGPNAPFPQPPQYLQGQNVIQAGMQTAGGGISHTHIVDLHTHCFEAWWKRMKTIAATTE